MFKEILREAVEGLPGAVGAVFADREGEAVEHFFAGPEDDIKLMGAHQGILLGLLKEAVNGTGQGGVRAVMLAMEDNKVVVQPLKDGYFLALLLSNRCNSGVAMRAAREAAETLAKEI